MKHLQVWSITASHCPASRYSRSIVPKTTSMYSSCTADIKRICRRSSFRLQVQTLRRPRDSKKYHHHSPLDIYPSGHTPRPYSPISPQSLIAIGHILHSPLIAAIPSEAFLSSNYLNHTHSRRRSHNPVMTDPAAHRAGITIAKPAAKR